MTQFDYIKYSEEQQSYFKIQVTLGAILALVCAAGVLGLKVIDEQARIRTEKRELIQTCTQETAKRMSIDTQTAYKRCTARTGVQYPE